MVFEKAGREPIDLVRGFDEDRAIVSITARKQAQYRVEPIGPRARSQRCRGSGVTELRDLRQKLRLLQNQTVRYLLEVACQQRRAAKRPVKNEVRGTAGRSGRKSLEQRVEIDQPGDRLGENLALIKKGGASKDLTRHLHKDHGALL